ncbi:hypothetical protein IFM89_037460 [Coptis chinensis]|uniref:60S ribosomal protein L7a n=1 Tax=Coptis chinensis TaxID=261450 RepID=A0A835LSX8_9MAGN|nr:hypothetical protein IFM89_037460 [Coptis chinensis]
MSMDSPLEASSLRIYSPPWIIATTLKPALLAGPKKRCKAPAPAKKKVVEKATNPLFEKRTKRFGIGGALPPKKDLHRFVKWRKVVHIQRQQRILKQRLKVPPALNQLTKTLDKNLAVRVSTFSYVISLACYSPCRSTLWVCDPMVADKVSHLISRRERPDLFP